VNEATTTLTRAGLLAAGKHPQHRIISCHVRLRARKAFEQLGAVAGIRVPSLLCARRSGRKLHCANHSAARHSKESIMIQFIRRPLCAALFGAIALAAPFLASGQTYNATKSFTPQTQTNPNGVWAYGYLAPGSNDYIAYPDFDSVGTDIAWQDLTHIQAAVPSFHKNVGDSVVDGVEPGQISLHPGFTIGASPFDDASVLRFTAPTSASYRIKLHLFAGDIRETEAWVVKNGNLNAPLVHFPTTSVDPSWFKTLKLNKGTTVDVIVGHSSDDFSYDNTPLSLVITKVPAAFTQEGNDAFRKHRAVDVTPGQDEEGAGRQKLQSCPPAGLCAKASRLCPTGVGGSWCSIYQQCADCGFDWP
jgi:hypothetical protein